MRKLLIVAAAMLAAASVAPAATSAQTSASTSAPISASTSASTSARSGAAQAGILAGPSASALLGKTNSCNQISNGKFRTDEETGRTVPVCDANGAVWWRADMDIDCDGQRT